jgi:hypothetical protein
MFNMASLDQKARDNEDRKTVEKKLKEQSMKVKGAELIVKIQGLMEAVRMPDTPQNQEIRNENDIK